MSDTSLPLYRRVLGSDFERLPRPIQDLHDVSDSMAAGGQCEIARGSHFLVPLIAGLFRLPPAGRAVPVTVTFRRQAEKEIWHRRFGQAEMKTLQEACPLLPGHIIERFGPLACRLEIECSQDGLRLLPHGLRLFGLPLPRWLWPRVAAGERVEAGRFTFDVAIGLPWVGLLVHYSGQLSPKAGSQPCEGPEPSLHSG